MYLGIKLIHIISATLLFGTGLGSAFYMFMAYKSQQMPVIYATNRLVVLADFWFTTPTIIIQLLSGLFLLDHLGVAWTSPWSVSVLSLYAFVGLCWLPVVWLQMVLRDRAKILDRPDRQYRLYMKIWTILGLLAFPCVLVLFAFMVYKPFFYQ